MFTSQSLRAVVKPGSVAFGEHRLDDVVHQIDVRGTLDDAAGLELGRRVESALAGGVRWLILDLAEAIDVSDRVLAGLVSAGGALRARRGELIVAGAPRSVAERLAAYDVAHRPALAANVSRCCGPRPTSAGRRSAPGSGSARSRCRASSRRAEPGYPGAPCSSRRSPTRWCSSP
jgi:anti-anti-sigma regulatory factor